MGSQKPHNGRKWGRGSGITPDFNKRDARVLTNGSHCGFFTPWDDFWGRPQPLLASHAPGCWRQFSITFWLLPKALVVLLFDLTDEAILTPHTLANLPRTLFLPMIDWRGLHRRSFVTVGLIPCNIFKVVLTFCPAAHFWNSNITGLLPQMKSNSPEFFTNHQAWHGLNMSRILKRLLNIEGSYVHFLGRC